jgi:hypothetical protein
MCGNSTENVDMPTQPPLQPLPTQRVLDRLTEIESKLQAMSDSLSKSLEAQLTVLGGDIAFKMRVLAGPSGTDPSHGAGRLSARELLLLVLSTAVGTAFLTTVVALLLQR